MPCWGEERELKQAWGWDSKEAGVVVVQAKVSWGRSRSAVKKGLGGLDRGLELLVYQQKKHQGFEVICEWGHGVAAGVVDQFAGASRSGGGQTSCVEIHAVDTCNCGWAQQTETGARPICVPPAAVNPLPS